jgi:uncharacterized protein YbjT (DUF2867 family)
MRIVVNTPTGNIGHAVTEHLLNSGEDIVLLARHPEKVHRYAERGAKVRRGDLEDPEFLDESLRDADALLWVTPPKISAEDVHAYQRHLGEIMTAAVNKHKVGHVVNLTSVGAQEAHGNGPIDGLHAIEQMLNSTGAAVTHLRCAYFMENFFFSLPTIVSEGRVYLPLPADLQVEMIATRDIGKVAAERLLAGGKGQQVVELTGPGQLSIAEATREIGQAIGKNLSCVAVPHEAALQSMVGMGMTRNAAELMVQMYDSIRDGKMRFERRPQRTDTSFERFAREVFRPRYAMAAGTG